MKLDLNKIVFSMLFSVLPIYVFLNRLELDINIMSLVVTAFVIEVFMVAISEAKNKNIRIAVIALALVSILFFNNIEYIKLGLDELLDCYGSLVKVKKSGNEIIGILFNEAEYVPYLVRLYFEIAIPCLYFVYGNRLWKIIYIDITIPFIILVFAASITPNITEMCMLIVMYILLIVTPTQKSNVVDISNANAKPMLLVYSFIITAITLFVTNIFINEESYERSSKLTELKTEINAYVSGEKEFNFKNVLNDILDQMDLDLNVGNKSFGGGMSDGKLGRVDKIEFTGEKIMDVRITSKSYELDYYPLYVKYFVGTEYTGNSWEKLTTKDERLIENLLNRYDINLSELDNLQAELLKHEDAYIHFIEYDSHSASENNNYVVTIDMYDNESKDYYWVYNSDTSTDYDYDGQRSDLDVPYKQREFLVYGGTDLPSYKDVSEIRMKYGKYPYYNADSFNMYSSTLVQNNYERTIKIINDYEAIINSIYTRIPESFESTAEEIRQTKYKYNSTNITMNLRKENYTGVFGYEPYVFFVQEYLSSRCTYTLSPGKLEAGEDFVNKFLNETKEGYCTHFASAGVLIFRSMGIPARYVTGYAVTDGVGERGASVAEVRDDSAHAWVEIFIPNLGWRPVEVTPSNYRDVIDEEIGDEGTTQEDTTEKATTTREPVTEPTTTKPTEDKTTEDGTSSPKETTSKDEGGSKDDETHEGTDDEENDESSDSDNEDITKVITYIIIVLVILMCIIGILNIAIYRRNKKMKYIETVLNSDRYNKICKIMIEQLMSLAKIMNIQISMSDTVANTWETLEKICSGVDEKTCLEAAKAIYKRKYSKDDMNKEEAMALVNVVQNAIAYQYNNSNILRKTYMSYIKCLYLYKK